MEAIFQWNKTVGSKQFGTNSLSLGEAGGEVMIIHRIVLFWN
jgi:hypothetical protein